ncbi:hypothetical protein OSTOST_00047 [Ostertagia ostertagi]
MSFSTFSFKTTKQKLTRQLNTLNALMKDVDEYETAWTFPKNPSHLECFVIEKQVTIKHLRASIEAFTAEDKTITESNFDEYWKTKAGERLLTQAMETKRLLDKRLSELDSSKKQNNETSQSQTISSWLSAERRLLSNDLKIPDFYGNPSEFGPFWELFDELVNKQPYTNIEKLSILLNCCKGDAARSLRMIPRS